MALSVAVAVFASYTAFHLVVRLAEASSRVLSTTWLIVGALSMGGGIWSMHFIAMLAVELPRDIHYDMSLTLLSVVTAILASGFAFQFVIRVKRRLLSMLAGGTLLGAGIGAMHYTGMAAMHMDAAIRYDPWMFAASVVVAATLSTLALRLLFHNKERRNKGHQFQRLFSSCVMGLSIAAMHYTGMAATYFVPVAQGVMPGSGIDSHLMATVIGSGSVFVVSLALVASVINQALKIRQLKAQVSEQSLKAIVDFVGEAIITIDEQGVVQSFNPAAQRTFGYDEEEIVGANVSILIPTETRGLHEDGLRKSKLGDSRRIGVRRTLKGLRKGGDTFDIELSVSSMEAGGKRYFIGLCADVSERKHAEATLRRALQQADAANRAKSEFLAAMSHEIRTPMNGVLGMAEQLAQTELTTEQNGILQTVRDSGNALLNVLNDILDLSKIEAGRMELDAMDFSIAELLQSTRSLWAHAAESKGLTFSIRNQLRDCDLVKADRARLRQVINNLVGNAVKFTATGQVELHVMELAASGDSVDLRFEVRDTGIGIPPEQKETLFEPFSQADSSITRRFGGTGLGLTISRSLVALFGGRIGVESTLDEGSNFWFTVRLARSNREAVAREQATGDPAPPIDLDYGARLRILVAEDNPVNQKVISWMLAPLECQFDIVENGLEAVSAVTRTPYDLVLMDIQMPHMDGITATKRIRSLDGPMRAIPIVAISANAMRGDRETYLAAGMNGYVSKPLDQQEFLRAIAECTNVGIPQDVGGPSRHFPEPEIGEVPVSGRGKEALEELVEGLDGLLDGTTGHRG